MFYSSDSLKKKDKIIIIPWSTFPLSKSLITQSINCSINRFKLLFNVFAVLFEEVMLSNNLATDLVGFPESDNPSFVISEDRTFSAFLFLVKQPFIARRSP